MQVCWKRHGHWRSKSAKDGYVKDSVETDSLFPRVLVFDVCKFMLQIILFVLCSSIGGVVWYWLCAQLTLHKVCGQVHGTGV